MKYLPIIGMEIHVEPTTVSKMFCECPADHFGKPANSHTCPVCLGLPGALPIPNQKAIDACISLGLALGCQINLQSKFDRKNYFYPDLPKAYQISQYDLPFCYEGKFEFPAESSKPNDLVMDMVGITRIHMEEDTGKSQHQSINGLDVSLIDYNRSGVPLIEIVTKPHLHSPSQTKQFLKWLVKTIEFLGISECSMETGALRLEANISVAEVEEDVLHVEEKDLPKYKVEVKNVNSFRFIEKAIEYEIKRHIEILKTGKLPVQETRGFSEDRGVTFSQRTKEEAQDYRYFPEPDIPPINTSQEKVDFLKPNDEILAIKIAQGLVNKGVRVDYLAQVMDSVKSYHVISQVIEEENLKKISETIKVSDVANVVVNQKLDLNTISVDEINKVLKSMVKSYAMNEIEVEKYVKMVLEANPAEVVKYKEGKTQVLGFLVGMVARETKGRADPKVINQLLVNNLS